MVVIHISGFEVMVDDEDAPMVLSKKWHINWYALKNRGLHYFLNNTHIDGKSVSKSLHRTIMGCVCNDGKVVDHIDGNTLNCTKENMRICSHTGNMRNQTLHKNNKTGYKGVSRRTNGKRFTTYIRVGGKTINCGTFSNAEDAAKRYDECAIKYFGEFSRLNFPLVKEVPGEKVGI